MDSNPIRDFWTLGSEGDMTPEVDAADLRSVLTLVRTLPPNTAIGMAAFASVCRPGADLGPICYRASMLVLLSQQIELLSTWIHDGEFADALLKIGAKFPLKKLAVGVVQEGYPLDVEEFVKQVAKESEPKAGLG